MTLILPMIGGGYSAGAAGFPEVTTTTYDGEGVVGYVLPGGIIATAYGLAGGGSISESLLVGFVTDAFWWDGGLIMYFVGDAISALSGATSISIDGTPYTVAGSPIYYAAEGITEAGYTVASGVLVAGVSQTIQFVT
jgi:hypothetical protein